jgi:hypothetical protein
MKKFFTFLLIPLALSCVKDPITPDPIVETLPERPIGVSVDGILEKQIYYNPSDTSISKIINTQSTNPNPIEFEYDNNGTLIGWGRSTVSFTNRFFNHTNDSTEMMNIDDLTGDTIQEGYKTIIRYDNRKRVVRIVGCTPNNKSSTDYEYDVMDNISLIKTKNFSNSGTIYSNELYSPTYDTLLNPFYNEKNHFLSIYFGEYSFNYHTSGSKHFVKSLVGPTRIEFENIIEYDYYHKRISRVLSKDFNYPTEIIEFIY